MGVAPIRFCGGLFLLLSPAQQEKVQARAAHRSARVLL
jgi:hypothetical protein